MTLIARFRAGEICAMVGTGKGTKHPKTLWIFITDTEWRHFTMQGEEIQYWGIVAKALADGFGENRMSLKESGLRALTDEEAGEIALWKVTDGT